MVGRRSNQNPGVVFGESIFKGKGNKRSFHHDRTGGMRSNIFVTAIVISCALLVLKLFFVQIIQGKYYRNLSDNNRIKTLIIHSPRGTIFDRNDTPLVFNVPGYRENVNGKTKLLTNEQGLMEIAKGNQKLEIDSLRKYPYGESLSHVLGYIGQISKEDLASPKFADYLSGDLIGQMGIEEEYERNLRGIDGKELLEVDSMGKKVRDLGRTEPVPGDDIHLTIDVNIQKKAFEAMSKINKGAVVVSTPEGEVLAMVSKPSFDPNLFTLGSAYKPSTTSGYQTITEVLTDNSNQPLLNRATDGVYPPGSTFKIVVASAGLQNKIIDENYQVNDTGILKVGDFSFANWYYTDYGRTDGEVNVVKGLKRSNDIFFYKLAEKIGVDKLSETAKNFDIGSKLQIDFPVEAAGILPTPAWKEKAIGEQWYLGDTYHYGIGQGYLLTTPLQVNSWAQIIANSGDLYQPHLNLAQGNKKIRSGIISSETSSLVRQGMIEACSTGGVAWPLFNYAVKNSKIKIDNKNFEKVASGSADSRHVVVACKTGTAQHGNDTTLPHSWITLFAPAYNPQIVVTVLAEESGEGSNVAAPIAKQILDAYFGNLK